MTDLGNDLRYGMRMLRKRPGTSALAIVALALGIGLTTTMFSIVDAAFLRGLPFEDSGRIVSIARQRMNNGTLTPAPPHDFVDWRASQHSFEEIAGVSTFTANLASSGDLPERYRGASISPNLLHLLRVAPATGRDFIEADGQPSAPPVALISYNMWLGRFQHAGDVVGRTIRINGQMATIVGVMPERFGFPQTQDLWMPLQVKLPAKRGSGTSMDVVGRLKHGVSVAAAKADMKLIADQLAKQYPEDKDFSADVTPYIQRFIGPQIMATLSTMLAAVFGVLLIACVNVTNLQLARAAERMKEMAVRFALGATRRRIVQQLLVEGLLLSATGALLGLAIAQIGDALFMRGIAGTNPPFWIIVHIDGPVLGFVTLLALTSALASSLVPALRVARQSVNSVLKDDSRSSTSLRVGVFSRMLVVVEMTLSFVLLVVSGLMIKSVIATSTVAYPFATDRLMARMNLNERDFPEDAQLREIADRVRRQLASTPGVAGVAMASSLPDRGGSYVLRIEGQALPADESQWPSTRRLQVTPEFFDVLNVRVTEGRDLRESDREGALPVAVASEDFVRKFFPKGAAIGKRIQTGRDATTPWWTIVGVVPSLAVAPQPGDSTETVFVPYAQAPSRDVTFLVAARGDPAAAGVTVRRAVVEVDPNLPLFEISTLQGRYDQSSWPFRVFGSLFMTFGLSALLMAAAGLYGVMSFAVRRRTEEIGVRMALGADRRRITTMVVTQGIWQVGIGIALGFGAGGYLATLLKLLLFQVRPWDPIVFGCTIAVLSAAGLLASLVPALRAASVDPLVALRRD